MSAYTIDLGIDWDSVAQWARNNNYQLLHGWLEANGQFNLSPSDRIVFAIYDLGRTKVLGNSSAPPTSFQVSFAKGDIGTSTSSPALLQTYPTTDFIWRGNKHSKVFGSDLRSPPQVSYPSWGPRLSGQGTGGVGNGTGEYTYVQVPNAGRFLYQITLQITSGGETRTFSFDPEMIVRDD